MIDSMCRPVSPTFVCPTLRFGCQGCKDRACKQKTVDEEEISIEDIARGDYIVGHYSDAEGPIPMKAPRDMTPDEWARHVVTHLPYNCACCLIMPASDMQLAFWAVLCVPMFREVRSRDL